MSTIRDEIKTALQPLRVYGRRMPKNVILPACVYTIVAHEVTEDLAGDDNGLERAQVQIDAYSQFEDEADAVAEQARTLLRASKTCQVTTLARFDDFEDDTRLYRVSRDFDVWRNP